jgi:exosome complex component RRP41
MCLALMQAGISMSDMVVACTVGYVKSDLCLDLSQLELSADGAYIPIAIKARSEEVIHMQLDSRLSIDLLSAALEKSIFGCRYIKIYIENAIKEYMTSQLENMK